MKTLFSILCSLLILSSYSQDKINQLDADGKRDGKWVLYLDKDWAKVKDSASASFFRYTFYDHGIHIHPMGRCGGKNFKLEKPNENKLLDGEYKWYNAKGQLSSVHVFKNGEYVSCKEYFPTGELNQYFDYTKKCAGQEHSWTVFVYDKKGHLILASPTCKDENGHWPKMRG